MRRLCGVAIRVDGAADFGQNLGQPVEVVDEWSRQVREGEGLLWEYQRAPAGGSIKGDGVDVGGAGRAGGGDGGVGETGVGDVCGWIGAAMIG